MYQNLLTQANNQIITNGQDVLAVPYMGNNLFHTQLHVRQPIFLFGQVYNINKQAKAGIGASRSELEKIKHDITYEVNERYQKRASIYSRS